MAGILCVHILLVCICVALLGLYHKLCMFGFIVSSRRGVLGVDVRMSVDIKQYTVNNVVFASNSILDKNALCISIGGRLCFQRYANQVLLILRT
jgi:hypothetical protein